MVKDQTGKNSEDAQNERETELKKRTDMIFLKTITCEVCGKPLIKGISHNDCFGEEGK